MNITIRPATPADIGVCARIAFDAFKNIATQHGFPMDFPSLEIATYVMTDIINNPKIFGVVAEKDGKVVGSNFLNEKSVVRGVGPISVDTTVQQAGVGRKLMEAILERGRQAEGIRLMQDAFNMSSMSLYTSLGFAIKEPLLVMTGNVKDKPVKDVIVRVMKKEDIAECHKLCQKVYGFERAIEIDENIEFFIPVVALREGKIIAYATGIHFWPVNHAVAENNEDMCALMLGAAKLKDTPLSFLLPTRNTAMFRWCLQQGLRAESPRTLMAMGQYHDPKGCFLPSVIY